MNAPLLETDPRPDNRPAYTDPLCPRCHGALTVLPAEDDEPQRHDCWQCVPCNEKREVRILHLDLPMAEEHRQTKRRKVLLANTRYEESWRKRAEHFSRAREVERAQTAREALNDNADPDLL